jgi:YfiH family protein
VHGKRVLDLDSEVAAGPADGSVTSRVGTICAVLTADCVPVLLAARGGERVGAAHVGWRGLVAGVLPAAVAALGHPPRDVLAWLGPAISQPAFEVGDEVRAAFETAGFDCAGAFARNARGRWQADLHGLAVQSLRAAGVSSVNRTEACTYREPDRFFSHRREAPCGRFATLIWIAS